MRIGCQFLVLSVERSVASSLRQIHSGNGLPSSSLQSFKLEDSTSFFSSSAPCLMLSISMLQPLRRPVSTIKLSALVFIVSDESETSPPLAVGRVFDNVDQE